MKEIFSDRSLEQNQVKCLSIIYISEQLQMKKINSLDLKVNTEKNQKQGVRGSDISLGSEEFQKKKIIEPKYSESSGELQEQKIIELKKSNNSDEYQQQIGRDPEVSVISEVFQMQSAIGITSSSLDNGFPGNEADNMDQINNSKEDICLPPDAPPKMTMQVVASIVVALTHFSVGATSGFSGVTFPQLTQPNSGDIFLDSLNAAFFGSFTHIGTFFGGIISASFIAWIGVRKTMLLVIPTTFAFWLLLTFSPNVTSALVSRMALGIMVALLMAPSNVYVVEIAHKDRRGLLFGTIAMARQCGFLFIFVIGSSSLTWRQLALICSIVPLVIPFIGLFFFPESPRWLMTKGREEEAKKSLLYFRGENYDIQSELNAITEEVEADRKRMGNNQCRQLFSKSNFKILIILITITLFNSGNGSFPISSYTVLIFQSSGSNVDPYMSTILVGCCRAIGTFIHTMTVDQFGRRYFQMFCFMMMSSCLALFGACNYLQDVAWVTTNLSWLPLTSILSYTFFLGLGQPIVLMLQGELLPTNIRHIGLSILVSTLYFGASVTTILFPTMNESIGQYGSFWTFSLCCFMVTLVTYLAIPETSGLSLEEISKRDA